LAHQATMYTAMGSHAAAGNNNDGILKIGNVEVARVGHGSELKKNHDAYEEVKYNHGEYRDSAEGGRDVQVNSLMTVKKAKVPIPNLTEWLANSSVWTGIVKSLDKDETEMLSQALQDAAYEEEGLEMWSSVKMLDPRTKTIRVLLVATRLSSDNCIRFMMVSHKEIAFLREGLMYNQKWHDDAMHLKMMTDWCTYRMFQKLGKEGLDRCAGFLVQESKDDLIGPAPRSIPQDPAAMGSSLSSPRTANSPLSSPRMELPTELQHLLSLSSPRTANASLQAPGIKVPPNFLPKASGIERKVRTPRVSSANSRDTRLSAFEQRKCGANATGSIALLGW